MEKERARALVKKRFSSLGEAELEALSEKLCDEFLRQPFYREADAVYTYVSGRLEINTDKIIKRALSDGKKVAVPKVKGKGSMSFYYISGLSDLSPGFAGIREPKGVTERVGIKLQAEPESESRPVLLMPGLAFDAERHRVGFGGGYYDRYLAEHPKARFIKVALACDFQLFDELDSEEHDLQPDKIILTDEKRCIN